MPWYRIRGVPASENEPYDAKERGTDPPAALLRSAALAAELLENACAPGSGDPLRLEVVRSLTRDLQGELEVLVTLADGETGMARIEEVEGALRAADVANLAACAAPELIEARAREAAAAAHLAAGAARALGVLTEASTGDSHGHQAPYALRDARGATWRARLAARQVDEFLGETG